MKLTAELDGQDYEVVVRQEGQEVRATVAGRSYNLVSNLAANGEYLLLNGSEVHYCRVENERQHPEQFVVHVAGRRYEIRIADPRRLRRSSGSGAHHHGAAEVVASMPGKLVRVMVEVGTQVGAGASLVVVEAMKMQNEMKAPKAGVVTSINVAPGATVNAGDVLVVIE